MSLQPPNKTRHFFRPTWVEISPSIFSNNVRAIKNFVGEGIALLAVVKANAYGHGAPDLAPLAIQNGASLVGVSSLEEGISLRESGFDSSILILGGIFPLDNFSVAEKHNLIPTVGSFDAAVALQKLAFSKNKSMSFHLKVDTGMGRIGVSSEEAKRILDWVVQQKEIRIEGVYSHLSSADSDPQFTANQIGELKNIQKYSKNIGIKNLNFHLANSAGLMVYSDSHFHMVRPGLALYGYSPTPIPSPLQISPVLSWHTQIIFLKKVSKGTSISYGRTFITPKESVIATLPVGYADGVPRAVSGKGSVLVSGKRCPIVGRVTMDQIMVDVTGLNTRVGDSVVLIGQQNNSRIEVTEWSDWAGTIPYEIFCGISARVPRVMV